MNWQNMQLSKLETNYTKACSEVFYRMTVLKISASSQESTCCGVRFSKVQALTPQFCWIRTPAWVFFFKNAPKFLEELVLCNTSGKLFLNLQKILIVPTPSTNPLVYGNMGKVSGGILNFFIVECDGHVVRYGFVELVESQSILVATNLFLQVHLTYYVHQFNWIEL